VHKPLGLVPEGAKLSSNNKKGIKMSSFRKNEGKLEPCSYEGRQKEREPTNLRGGERRAVLIPIPIEATDQEWLARGRKRLAARRFGGEITRQSASRMNSKRKGRKKEGRHVLDDV